MHEPKGRPLMLPLERLRLDGDTHGRARLLPEVIHDYAEELGRSVEFPPVVAFHDGEHYFLADGFLRWHAHERAGRSHIAVDVRPGGVRDARMYAASANATHGLRRSYEDRRRAVLLVLEDEEGRRWSAAQIAKHCAVSEPFVQGVQVVLAVDEAEGQAGAARTQRAHVRRRGGGRRRGARPRALAQAAVAHPESAAPAGEAARHDAGGCPGRLARRDARATPATTTAGRTSYRPGARRRIAPNCPPITFAPGGISDVHHDDTTRADR